MSQDDRSPEHRRRVRSFVVRPGRTTALQQRALDTLSARYCIPVTQISDNTRLDLPAAFPHCTQYIAEIGFGMGVATAALAAARPETGYLGIEVFPAGVGKLLSEIARLGLDNVKIIQGDAVVVFDRMVPPASLDGIHLFFPDPWPKKRHHKRRLLQTSFVSMLASSLKPAGYLYVVTDWEDYAEHVLEVLRGEPELTNAYAAYADPQPWRPTTKFETKGRADNREIRELYFTKPRRAPRPEAPSPR